MRIETMLLAFYKVSNSLNYERHTFDYICDKPDKVLEMLRELQEDEYRIYDLSTTRTNVMHYTLRDFEEDYNDEIIDGKGWWCIVLQ